MVSVHSTTVLLGLTVATSLFLLSTALPTVVPPHRYPYDSSSASSVVLSSSSSTSSQQSNSHFYARDPSRRTKEQVNNVIVEDLQSPQQPRRYSQDSSSSRSGSGSAEQLGRDSHAFLDHVLTRPSHPLPQQNPQHHSALSSSSSSPSTSLSTPPSPPHTPLSPSRAGSNEHAVAPINAHPNSRFQHTTDLRVHAFKSHGVETPQDQILHQCTTHFLALLDTEISDRLLAQLSRLVMMLPVIGVETRAVIRTKVAEVMQQIVAGLTHYEAVKRVIRTAVDDAGLVLLVQPVTVEHSLTSRRRRRREGDLFSMVDGRYEQISEYDDVDDEIPTTTTTTATTTTTPTIDESQIPVLTDIAMEAVLDYMSEILTPSLVIRQLTEAIQDALFEINKQRKVLHRMRVQQHGSSSEDEDGYLEDVNGDGDSSSFDLDDLSSELLGGGGRRTGGSLVDRHGIDLLSDGWILSGPSSSSSRSHGESSVDSLLEDEEYEDDDSRGQDEDLWDKDMEIHEWDSTGRLFDDFEDLEDNISSDSTDSAAQLVIPSATEQDMENWDMATTTAGDDADDVEEEDEENSDPFSIGIRDRDDAGGRGGRGGSRNYNDGDGEDEDEDDNDPMADTREDYGRERYLQQSYFNRFQKRSLFNTPDTTVAESQKPAVAPAAKPATAASATRTTTTTTTTTAKTIRRPNITPDLRLENLLTQLIEPLLTTFIEEDFPASCKRVQGELMDGIIWSLDQGELNGSSGGSDGLDSDEERMLLLSELEY
ncbi:MAG: hypothetical protein J3R72DRAFT_490265 [Linnemannia gamsii]|nr:MAG: hypothetical protein J3R72DRAFT_490265 [Linnemannia gamsii]